MKVKTTVKILDAAERASVDALVLHGLLLHEGLPHHARMAWSLHEDVAGVAETLGRELKVDVKVK